MGQREEDIAYEPAKTFVLAFGPRTFAATAHQVLVVAADADLNDRSTDV